MSTCGSVYPPTSSQSPRANYTPVYTFFAVACVGATSGCPNLLGTSSVSISVNGITASSASMTVSSGDRKITFSFMVNFGSTTVTTANVKVNVGSATIADFTISGINVTGVAMFEVTFTYSSI